MEVGQPGLTSWKVLVNGEKKSLDWIKGLLGVLDNRVGHESWQ